jgi:hypothetical protein
VVVEEETFETESENVKGYPYPRVFLRKSSEMLDRKRVEFLKSAKEFGRV